MEQDTIAHTKSTETAVNKKGRAQTQFAAEEDAGANVHGEREYARRGVSPGDREQKNEGSTE